MTPHSPETGAPTAALPGLDGVLFVAMENWDEMWRRNQPVAAGFADLLGDRPVLYVGRHRDVSHLVRKKRIGEALAATFGGNALRPSGTHGNVHLINPVKLLPNTLAPCRAFNRWHERVQLRSALRRLGVRRPMLWMNPYYAVHMPGRMNEGLSVYDVGDDWTRAPQSSAAEKRRTIAEDESLTRKADVNIMVSEALIRLKQGVAERLHHIPNGVYAERYAGVAEHAIAPHPAIASLAGPVLGYTGTLHDERIDVELVAALADARPDFTIALVGPSHLRPASRELLGSRNNVRFIDPVPFEQVPALMAGFDVSIVPHRVNDFTESLSPLKLYEAMAAGLPMVSTPVAGFRDHADLFDLAASHAGFIAAVERALDESHGRAIARRAAAERHTWPSRLEAILTALHEAQRELATDPPATSPPTRAAWPMPQTP
ncbi:MAG: glycosyltransferase [Planctomycetota bacterium]